MAPWSKSRNGSQARDPLLTVKSKPTPWMMPCDIVEMIFKLLRGPDRVCFALSCKRVYACYVSHNQQCKLSVLPKKPWVDFLRRLENDRWAYCGECELLHRDSKANALRLRSKCIRRPSILDCTAWCLIPHAGKVDICPCSSITFHQMQHECDYFQYQGIREQLLAKFKHPCSLDHALGWAKTETRMWFKHIYMYGGTFHVETRFFLKSSRKTASKRLFEKLHSAASQSAIELWLKEFLRPVQSKFFIGGGSSNSYQLSARDETGDELYRWDITGKRPRVFLILLHRNLGGKRWPGKGWNRNCHD